MVKTLEQEVARYRSEFNTAFNMQHIIDPNGKIISANRAALDTLGYQKADYIGKHISEITHPDCRMKLLSLIKKTIMGERFFFVKSKLIKKTGKLIHVELTATPHKAETPQIELNFRVTGQGEKSIPRQMNLVNDLIEILPSPVYIKDLQGRFLGCNKAFVEFIGYPRQKIINRTVFDLHPTEAATVFFEKDRELQANPGRQIFEGSLLNADGDIREIILSKATFDDKAGNVSGIVGIITDFTDRARAEKAHFLDEARLEALFELSQLSTDATIKDITDFALEEAIRLTNSKLGYLAFTKKDESMLSMYSWSRQAMKDCGLTEKPLDYVTSETGLWGEAVRQRKAVITNNYQTPSALKKGYPEGHIQIMRHMNIPVFEKDHIVAVAGVGNKPTDYEESDLRQLTLLMQGMWRLIQQKKQADEQKKIEEELQQARKMEAIGTLSSGIAHDFNNILFPIIGYTEMLLEDVEQHSPDHEKLGKIYKAALRASDLVNQILTYARKETKELRSLNMGLIVKEVLKFIKSILPSTITIHQDIQTDCGLITADPTQIHQIVMNLATNAYHAMEKDGGELTVNLSQLMLGDIEKSPRNLLPGQYACLSISDTGGGLTDEVKDKMFDPFFTTKKKGKGTGMGLSVVQGIVNSIGGAIQAKSKIGEGTEFKIFVPIQMEKSDPVSAEKDDRLVPGTERILIVDDETSIITLEKQMLERTGYKITAHTSSIEALEEFRANPAGFDLMITDYTMPQMTGDKLAHEILKIDPDFPILLATGYREKKTVSSFEARCFKDILIKPIQRNRLLKKIRAVLDKDKLRIR